MNEASNFCPFPCTNPAAYAIQAGDPPRPPPVRLGSPYPIPGFPADFQPQCVAEVSFNVTATTTTSESILISGNSTTLGVGMILDAVVMHNDGNGVWSVVVQMPPNSVVTYQVSRSFFGQAGSILVNDLTLSTFVQKVGQIIHTKPQPAMLPQADVMAPPRS